MDKECTITTCTITPDKFDKTPEELIRQFSTREEYLDLNAVPKCNEWPVWKPKYSSLYVDNPMPVFFDYSYVYAPYIPA